MPLHRFNHDDAVEAVAAREADGETVVALATDETGVYVATTPRKTTRQGGSKETR